MNGKERQYYFILGFNPSLSLAELAAVFGMEQNDARLVNREILVMKSSVEIDAEKLIERLGGTIKIGLIEGSIEKFRPDLVIAALKPQPVPGGGKFKFGFSYYGQKSPNLKPLGMEMKRHFQENGVSARWVVSRERVLSSVVVEQNRLCKGGLEAVLIEDGKTLLLGRTLAVQPFKILSMRDYGRPARDDQSGMIPPKLAMMMINLAWRQKANPEYAVFLDPFCGSGTVLQEAALFGFKHIIGSDISDKAVSDSQKNLGWLKTKLQIMDAELQIMKLSATELSRKLTQQSIDLIVTEPFLGPQRGKLDFKKVSAELNVLYSDAILEFSKILKADGRIVMIWPQFISNSGTRQTVFSLNPKLGEFEIIPPLPAAWLKNNIIRISQRNTMVYGRAGQKVWREIVVLKKK